MTAMSSQIPSSASSSSGSGSDERRSSPLDSLSSSSSTTSSISAGNVTPPSVETSKVETEDTDATSEYDEGLLPTIPATGEWKHVPVDQNTPDAWVERDERMIRLTGKHPFNSEAPLSDLWAAGFLTPNSLFYVRNHGYVPQVSASEVSAWRLRIHGLVDREMSFSLQELKKRFPTVTLPITLVCAGNRRKEQNIVAKGLGFHWGAAGVSTQLFTGVYLADVLSYCQPRRPVGAFPWNEQSVGDGRARHVIFEGIDELPNGKYGTSQRVMHCLDRSKGMLLAWGMGGEALSPDHGFPLRLVTPGQIGGRMVKWLNRIEVSDRESQHFLHFKDNKVLPTQLTADRARQEEHWWRDEKYIIYDLNVNAAICRPAHQETIEVAAAATTTAAEPCEEQFITVEGYAYTGGGKRIARVEISLDDGDTWTLADLDFPEDTFRQRPIRDHPYFGTLDLTQTEMSFAWCFWRLRVSVKEMMAEGCDVITLRAADEGLAQMPRDMYWNPTGMMNGCFFRVALHKADDGRSIRFEHPTIAGNTDGGWMQRLQAEGQDVRYPRFGKKQLAAAVEADDCVVAASAKPDDLEIMTDESKRAVRITAPELAQHANETNPWFVVRGHVFDGTGFLAGHPGGAESITLVAGEDATEDFMAIHSLDAKKKMKPFHVGLLDVDAVAAAAAAKEENKAAAEEENDPFKPWLQPKRWKTSKLVSKEIISHDSRVFRFSLDHPDQEAGLPIGQHVYVRIKTKSADGKEREIVQRAYTPFSNNELRGYIDILIKVYFPCDAHPAGGKMSMLIEQLEPGKGTVELKGPLGGFVYLGQGALRWRGKERKVKKVAMIAGGSGITPIWSTLKGIVDDGDESDVQVWIIDANRTESDILARTHLDDVVAASKGRIRLWHVLSGECAPDWAMGKGRVSIDMLRDYLPPPPARPTGAEELEDSIALVCGPPAMEKTISAGLTALGWDVERTVVFF